MEQPIRVAQVIGKWLGGGVESVVMNYYRNIDRTKKHSNKNYTKKYKKDNVFYHQKTIRYLLFSNRMHILITNSTNYKNMLYGNRRFHTNLFYPKKNWQKW